MTDAATEAYDDYHKQMPEPDLENAEDEEMMDVE